LGDAIYQSLASKQLVEASGHALDSQGQGSTLAAAQAYFDLLKAKAVVKVLREIWDVSLQYQKELQEAVKSGIAFKGDALRVETQTQQYGIAWRQATEHWRVSSAELARVLHLDAMVELAPKETDLVPLTLVPLDGSLNSMVRHALKNRPELHQSQSTILAAENQKNAVTFGPLVPTLNASAFGGGLGGGHGNSTTPFGPEEDYFVGLGWRLGPGGLFDFGRIHASRAQLSTVRLQDARLRDEITRQVVEGHAHASSLLDQIESRKANLATAEETLRLARSRRQFGVGVVLEYLLAQQDYSTAQTGYVGAIADYNKAQFTLTYAIGDTLGGQTVRHGDAKGETKLRGE
jgi:outer membrane protein TolC